MRHMPNREYQGLLLIGDPHLEGRQPGFRKDDYPWVILEKLQWCLHYAAQYALLPAILGDLFDKPRDNPTWMIGKLIEMLSTEVIGLYGNHDCADPVLCDHDSLSLLVKCGRLRLVDVASPWCGTMNGRPVVVGGSSYRQEIPADFECTEIKPGAQALVVWLCHHDISAPGYEGQKWIEPREIRGIDLVINGHIHRRLADVQKGGTGWLTPGNISRRDRSDAMREHSPAVLRIDVTSASYECHSVVVPHRPFDEVFHPLIVDYVVDNKESQFVSGLAELQARRTASGAGLEAFLEQNLVQFQAQVAEEIRTLAREVLANG
jgi:DNA repair exonuclease SbcCD nuclease subunit